MEASRAKVTLQSVLCTVVTTFAMNYHLRHFAVPGIVLVPFLRRYPSTLWPWIVESTTCARQFDMAAC